RPSVPPASTVTTHSRHAVTTTRPVTTTTVSFAGEGSRGIPYVEEIETHRPQTEKIRGLATEGSRQPRDPDRREAGAGRRDYRLGIAGVLLGASLPGAGLPLGVEPIVLPVPGEVGGAVGGEADGVRSRV